MLVGCVNNDIKKLLETCEFRYQTGIRSKNYQSAHPVFESVLLPCGWEADAEGMFTLSDHSLCLLYTWSPA